MERSSTFQEENAMEQSSCFREFARYTVLSILGTLGVSCYILADTFFISKGLGTNGLAALNFAIPIYNFIYGTGLMLGMGGATKFSVCKGQKQQEEINQIYTNTIELALLFSLFFMLPGMFFSPSLARFLGAEGAVLEMTTTYLRWLLFFSPAFILNNVLLCFVRNDESPQLVMAAMLIGSFANIFLDYIFIFPMQMGIFGAVFATGSSPLISIMVMSFHWIKKKNTFHWTKIGLLPWCVKQNLSLGFPSLVAQVSSGIVMAVFNRIILNLEGNAGVAAYGIIANLSLVVMAVYSGLAQGMQPLVSRFYGTGNKKQTRAVLGYAMVSMLIISIGIYGVISLLTQPIIAVFNSENNRELQEIAGVGLRLYFLASPFMGYNTILAMFFTSIEKALPAHGLSLLRGFILIIPAAFVLSSLWGITGVWMVYPLTEGVVGLLGLGADRYFQRK